MSYWKILSSPLGGLLDSSIDGAPYLINTHGDLNFCQQLDKLKFFMFWDSVLERLLRRSPLSALQLRQHSSADVKPKDGMNENGN